MALTESDMAYIREAAVNSATEVSEKIIEKVIKWHIASCPHGKSILAAKWTVIGACIASAMGGGTVGAVLMKIFVL